MAAAQWGQRTLDGYPLNAPLRGTAKGAQSLSMRLDHQAKWMDG
jgi:hypothetical protein